MTEHDKINYYLLQQGPEELTKTLTHFITEVRNSKGEHYPKETLFEMITCIQAHFHINGKYV